MGSLDLEPLYIVPNPAADQRMSAIATGVATSWGKTGVQLCPRTNFLELLLTRGISIKDNGCYKHQKIPSLLRSLNIFAGCSSEPI